MRDMTKEMFYFFLFLYIDLWAWEVENRDYESAWPYEMISYFSFRFSRVPFSSRIIMTRTTYKLFQIDVTFNRLENICNPTRIMIRTMTSITWPVLTMLLRKRCNLQPVFYHVIEKLMYIRAKKENPLYIFLLLPTWKFLKIQSKF